MTDALTNNAPKTARPVDKDKIIADLRKQLAEAEAINKSYKNFACKLLTAKDVEIKRLQTIIDNRAEDKEVLRKYAEAKEEIKRLRDGLGDLDFQSGCSWCEKNVAIATKALTTK